MVGLIEQVAVLENQVVAVEDPVKPTTTPWLPHQLRELLLVQPALEIAAA